MNPLQDRLRTFVGTLGISVQEFERKCGIKAGTASRMTEKSYGTTFHRIQTAYPELNMDWLKRGEGEMLKPLPTVDMSRRDSDGDNGDVDIAFGDIIRIGDARLVSEKDAEICELKKEVSLLRELLAERERVIAGKDERIEELKERVEELKARLK